MLYASSALSVLDHLLDEVDGVRPVPLVEDEDGAPTLVDLARDQLHHLVVDAEVVELVVHAAKGGTGRATGRGTDGAEEDGTDDDADGATTHRVAPRADLLFLMDLDPAVLGVLRDRRVDDLDVGVGCVDVLDALEEALGSLVVRDQEDGQGLIGTVAHESGLLALRSRWGSGRRSRYGLGRADG